MITARYSGADKRFGRFGLITSGYIGRLSDEEWFDLRSTGEWAEVDLAAQTLAADAAHLAGLGSRSMVRSVELTRPSDTTVYHALDAIANSTSAPTALTFSNAARVDGGSAYILFAKLTTNNPSCDARVRLHLFSTSPTAVNDNSPHPVLYANRATLVGHLDFPALASGGAGSDASQSLIVDARILVACAPSSRNLFGLVQTLDAFTPSSAQKFHFQIGFEQG